MPEGLHMIRLALNASSLFSSARRQRLPMQNADLGYLVHTALHALFGAQDAPKPFRVEDGPRRSISVLAYSRLPGPELVSRAQAFADPGAYAACDWETFVSKPMPQSFESGQQLGFSVRLCPVRRIAKAGPMRRDRAEVDVFLARCWQVGPDTRIDREAVYREFLADELAKGGAELLEGRMVAFSRERLIRRDRAAERTSHPLERPDARFDGNLTVRDPTAFGQLLERGLGRHRAFGFGMLLLRPRRS